MSDPGKIGLFLANIGLALLSAKASSAKLAREIGAPALLVSLVGGAGVGHGVGDE